MLVSRPEDIVDSIAIYGSGKSGDFTASGGMNYMAGKVGHIKRVKATDAGGNWTWCKQEVDVASGTWTGECPQDFLDKAVYPVVIDPTIGYTSGGATADGGGDIGYCAISYVSPHLASSGEYITGFSFYGSFTGQ